MSYGEIRYYLHTLKCVHSTAARSLRTERIMGGKSVWCDELGCLFRKWELSVMSICDKWCTDDWHDWYQSLTTQAILTMMSSKRISLEGLLQYFYNNHPNRKQLSRFWLSQCFSTGETTPDIMLLWAFEQRGHKNTTYDSQTVHLQSEAPQNTNSNLHTADRAVERGGLLLLCFWCQKFSLSTDCLSSWYLISL